MVERSRRPDFTMPATRRAHSPNDGPLFAALRLATRRLLRETGFEARGASVGMSSDLPNHSRRQASRRSVSPRLAGGAIAAHPPPHVSKPWHRPRSASLPAATAETPSAPLASKAGIAAQQEGDLAATSAAIADLAAAAPRRLIRFGRACSRRVISRRLNGCQQRRRNWRLRWTP